jgi:hypothetical protein
VDASLLRHLIGGHAKGYFLRDATFEDDGFIREVYAQTSRNLLFAASRSAVEWDYEFAGRSEQNTRRREWLLIENMRGERLGYVQYLPCIPNPLAPMLRVTQVELATNGGYLNLALALLRGLWERAELMFGAGELQCDELLGLEFALERDHPLYRVIPKGMLRETRATPWYIRIPDMVAFLCRISPALEKHLLGTVVEGYSGELRLNFFRSGIRVRFVSGRLLPIEDWKPDEIWEGDARLPESAFLQLVCGWHRFNELSGIFAECWASHEAAILLDCLFPAFHGKVWVLA